MMMGDDGRGGGGVSGEDGCGVWGATSDCDCGHGDGTIAFAFTVLLSAFGFLIPTPRH